MENSKFFNMKNEVCKTTQQIENPIVDKQQYGDYEILGFEIEKIRLDGNCIIFCYYDYDTIKCIYDGLQKIKPSQICLRIIVNPLDEYPFKLVTEFINRNIDIYCKGHIPKNIKSDVDREKEFLSNITNFNKVIYIGDVIKIWK